MVLTCPDHDPLDTDNHEEGLSTVVSNMRYLKTNVLNVINQHRSY